MNALIYVIDMAKREEYSVMKNYLIKAGYNVKIAIGSYDVNMNYDIDLIGKSVDFAAGLADEFDTFALVGGYKIYYTVLNKKPPLKIWDLNIDRNILDVIIREFNRSGKTIVAPLAVPGYIAQLGILKGRNATVYPTTELIKILRDNGANFVNSAAVKDGNIITVKDITAVSEKEFLKVVRK